LTRAVLACRKCHGRGHLRLPKHLDRDGSIPKGQLTITCLACRGRASMIVHLPVITADDRRRAKQQRKMDREEESDGSETVEAEGDEGIDQ
jgi:hypothetical protein